MYIVYYQWREKEYQEKTAYPSVKLHVEENTYLNEYLNEKLHVEKNVYLNVKLLVEEIVCLDVDREEEANHGARHTRAFSSLTSCTTPNFVLLVKMPI
jgi:hypothetical protein